MARRDVGGLAALGALGMLLAKKGSKASTGESAGDSYMDDTYNPDVKSGSRLSSSEDVVDETGAVNPRLKRNTETGDLYSLEAASAPAKRSGTPAKKKTSSGPAMMSQEQEADVRSKGGPRGTRYLPEKFTGESDMSAYKPRSTPEGSSPRTTAGKTYEPLTREQSIARLNEIDNAKPMDPNADRGPNAADSTELGRNASAFFNATGPGGVNKAARAAIGVAREFGPASAAQKAYERAQQARRAAEGFSPEEALAARKAAEVAAREAKTLNPNAWMAGPKGMAENFKKGGKVKAKPAKAEKPAAKGWGQARGARAAKYY